MFHRPRRLSSPDDLGRYWQQILQSGGNFGNLISREPVSLWIGRIIIGCHSNPSYPILSRLCFDRLRESSQRLSFPARNGFEVVQPTCPSSQERRVGTECGGQCRPWW